MLCVYLISNPLIYFIIIMFLYSQVTHKVNKSENMTKPSLKKHKGLEDNF